MSCNNNNTCLHVLDSIQCVGNQLQVVDKYVKVNSDRTFNICDSLQECLGSSSSSSSSSAAAATTYSALVQSKYAEYTTNANFTTVIPVDDTIPQITEGTEILTQTITPTSAVNKIRIRVEGSGAINNQANLVVALFVNTTTNALAASIMAASASFNQPILLEYEEIAGNTTARTYRIRVGSNNAGYTWAMNGTTGGRYLGGTMRSTLIVEELSPTTTLPAAMPVTNTDPTLCGGRLTLTSNTPVTTSDVTAAGTIYYTPYLHSRISLYDGNYWTINTFSELSLALTVTSGFNYDVFIYNNAGALTLETLVWTDNTNRATALVRQDGVWCKTGALTRRYLGTIRASGTNTTEDSGGGTTTQVGGKRYVWNMYNRMLRSLVVIDTTDSWAYTTNTWRQANGNTGNKVEYVCGLSENVVPTKVLANKACSADSAAVAKIGVGVDSTTVPSGLRGSAYTTSGTNVFGMVAQYNGFPGVGYHYLAWLEIGADGSGTWRGDNANDGMQSGLTSEILA